MINNHFHSALEERNAKQRKSNYKQKISAVLISSMVLGSLTPVFADSLAAGTKLPSSAQENAAGMADEESTPDPETLTVPIAANYYYDESSKNYTFSFTAMKMLPEFSQLDAAIELPITIYDGSFSSVLDPSNAFKTSKSDNTISFSMDDVSIKPTDKMSLFSAFGPLITGQVISADTVKIKAFSITDTSGNVITILPELTVQEGALIPELSDEEQDAYDLIAALPAVSELSYYTKDSDNNLLLTDLAALQDKVKAAQNAYTALSAAEKNNVDKVLEFNSLSAGLLSDLTTALSGMDKALGAIEIAYRLMGCTDKTALDYQYLPQTYHTKKGAVSTEGLPSGSGVYNEYEAAMATIAAAETMIADTLTQLGKDYDGFENRVNAIETQLTAIQAQNYDKFYNEYLTALKEQAADIKKEVNDSTLSDRMKAAFIEDLDAATAKIEATEKGIDSLPTYTVSEIRIGASYILTFTRKAALPDIDDAVLTVYVYDEDGKQIDEETDEFPKDAKKHEMSVYASRNDYPTDETVTIHCYYTIAGAKFDLGTQTAKCVYVANANNKPSGIGNVSSGSTNSSSGGTRFPSNSSDDDDDKDSNNKDDQTEVLFRDIENYGWAREAIEGLYYAGIVNGMEEGVFNPAGEVTREQFSKMVVQLFGVAVGSGTTSFADVDPNAWYAPYISAAVQAGYVQGQSGEYFGIGEHIMRQDMATMLYRAMGDQNSKAVLDFSDNDAIAPYANDAIAELVGLGVINGYEDGSFQPRGTATRAEAAKMIWGVYQLGL